jgi:hypothetical protein
MLVPNLTPNLRVGHRQLRAERSKGGDERHRMGLAQLESIQIRCCLSLER